MILLAFVAWANPTKRAVNHTANALSSLSQVFDRLADKLVARAGKQWPLCHAGLEHMTIGKPAHLDISRATRICDHFPRGSAVRISSKSLPIGKQHTPTA